MILEQVLFPEKVDAIISESYTISLSEELTMKKTRRTCTAEFKPEAVRLLEGIGKRQTSPIDQYACADFPGSQALVAGRVYWLVGQRS